MRRRRVEHRHPGQALPDREFRGYARAIHDVGDPVDAMAVHLYPVDTSGVRGGGQHPGSPARHEPVGIDRPLWDTEVNYGDRRAGLPQVVLTRRRPPRTWRAPTSTRSGWASRAPTGTAGTPTCRASTHRRLRRDPGGHGVPDRAGLADRARLAGCDRTDGMEVCRFADAAGRAFSIAWSSAANTVPGEGMRVCWIDGSCEKAPNQVTVDSEPVLVKETGSGG